MYRPMKYKVSQRSLSTTQVQTLPLKVILVMWILDLDIRVIEGRWITILRGNFITQLLVGIDIEPESLITVVVKKVITMIDIRDIL